MIKEIFNEDEAVNIRSLAISPHRNKDHLFWTGTSKGEFSVKSVYYLEK